MHDDDISTSTATLYLGRTPDREHVYAETRISTPRPGRMAVFTDHTVGPAPVELAVSFVVLAPRAPVHGGKLRPSAVADGYWRAAGQTGTEAHAARRGAMPESDAAFLVHTWERWHLNTMHAGCEHQGTGGTLSAPCIETGYRWGSAWLAETVPADVLDRLGFLASTYGIRP